VGIFFIDIAKPLD